MDTPAWNIGIAQQMKNAGCGWKAIGRFFGVTADTVRYRLDPVYRVQRQARVNERRRGKGYQTYASRHRAEKHSENRKPILPPPVDRRDLTAMIFGDPMPERSALASRSLRSL